MVFLRSGLRAWREIFYREIVRSRELCGEMLFTQLPSCIGWYVMTMIYDPTGHAHRELPAFRSAGNFAENYS